ncbi:MAG: hypothetical protein DRH12_03340 [Deltaproteobacteria bacterium]|nr:MAG: hypothetical protein DRH12_03340 [Deltaproteobacteria bacterium]
MKMRTLISLIFVLATFALAVTVLVHRRVPSEEQCALGKELFRDLDVNSIACITIQGPTEQLGLVKGKERWGVVQRYGYPADFAKIKELVTKIVELNVGRSFSGNSEVLSRLQLISPLGKKRDPEECGTLLIFKDKEGNQLGGIIIGKAHRAGEGQIGSSGQYVRFPDDDMVYLVDKSFAFMETDPKVWLARELLKVEPVKIKRISCFKGDGKAVYVLERKAKGKDFEATGVLKAKELDRSKIRRLERAISFLTLLDVAGRNPDVKGPGTDGKAYVSYELFDGTVYKIFPSRVKVNGKDEYHLRIRVGYISSGKMTLGEDVSDRSGITGAGTTAARSEVQDKARQLNEQLSPWVFVVSKWVADAFITDPERLVGKKGAKESQPRKSKPTQGKG